MICGARTIHFRCLHRKWQDWKGIFGVLSIKFNIPTDRSGESGDNALPCCGEFAVNQHSQCFREQTRMVMRQKIGVPFGLSIVHEGLLHKGNKACHRKYIHCHCYIGLRKEATFRPTDPFAFTDACVMTCTTRRMDIMIQFVHVVVIV